MSFSAAILSQSFVADLGNWLQAEGAAEPTPSPTEVLRPGLEKWDVTPGLLGFIAMFCIVLAAVAVWFSMSGKLRKIQHDERMQASAAQARSDADATEAPTETDADTENPSDDDDPEDPAAGPTSDRNPDGV